jgi:hypothetical protein
MPIYVFHVVTLKNQLGGAGLELKVGLASAAPRRWYIAPFETHVLGRV